MSSASELRRLAQTGTIHELVGNSGSTYLVFSFDDGSVCAARRRPSGNLAAARYEFGVAKHILDDCGVADYPGTTYQKGTELLRRLSAAPDQFPPERPSGHPRTPPRPGRRSKYQPLREHLEHQPPSVTDLTLSFSQIESILGFKLPASARKHRAWWSNPTDLHSHAGSWAWLSAGWRVDAIDQSQEWVRFWRPTV